MFLPMSSTRPWTSNERQSCSSCSWTDNHHHCTEFVTFSQLETKTHYLDKKNQLTLVNLQSLSKTRSKSTIRHCVWPECMISMSSLERQGAELTIHETSGLFDHHVRRVVKGGISLPGKRGGVNRSVRSATQESALDWRLGLTLWTMALRSVFITSFILFCWVFTFGNWETNTFKKER